MNSTKTSKLFLLRLHPVGAPRYALQMTKPLVFGAHTFFDTLTEKERAHLALHLQTRLAAPGSTLIASNTLRAPLLFIRQGQITLSRKTQGHGQDLFLQRRTAPCLAGETEVLTHRPALVEVRAQTAVQYAVLEQHALEQLCLQQVELASKLLHEVQQTMQEHSAWISQRLQRKTRSPMLRATAVRRPSQPQCIPQSLES